MLVDTSAQFSCCGKSWLESKGCHIGKHSTEEIAAQVSTSAPAATAATAGGALLLKKGNASSGLEKLEYGRALSGSGHLIKASAVAKRLHESTSFPLLKQPTKNVG
jgi:hypothetical protein